VKKGSASLLTIEAKLHCCGGTQVKKVLYVNATKLFTNITLLLGAKELIPKTVNV
jgi:hypothetical protein